MLTAICILFLLIYTANYLNIPFSIQASKGTIKATSSNLISTQLDPYLWGTSLLIILTQFIITTTKKWKKHIHQPIILTTSIISTTIVCLNLTSTPNIISLTFVSGLIFLLTLIWPTELLEIKRTNLLKRLILGLMLYFLILELSTLILYNIPTALNIPPSNTATQLHTIKLSLSNITYPLIPYTYLLLILIVIITFLYAASQNKINKKIKIDFLTKPNIAKAFDNHLKTPLTSGLTRSSIVLTVITSILITCLFVTLTVLPSTNPTYKLVSVDAPRYYEMITQMRNGDLNSAFSYAFANDRALFLLLAYAFSFIFNTIDIVQFASAILLSLFAIVCFLFLKSTTKSQDVWILGIMLVPFSFQAMVLIYAGFYANMLALILVFTYFLLFLKVRNNPSNPKILSLLFLSVLILFSHSWTWFIFAATLFGFLLLEWKTQDRKENLRLNAALISGSIAVGLVSDLVRGVLLPSSSTASVTATIQASLGISNPAYILSGMQKTILITLGGGFANPLLLLLMFIGFFAALRTKSPVSNFLLSWSFVSLFPILFAAAELVFARSLFMIPSAIFSGLGLSFLIKFLLYEWKDTKKPTRTAITMLIIGFVFLTLLNITLQYIFNLT